MIILLTCRWITAVCFKRLWFSTEFHVSHGSWWTLVLNVGDLLLLTCMSKYPRAITCLVVNLNSFFIITICWLDQSRTPLHPRYHDELLTSHFFQPEVPPLSILIAILSGTLSAYNGPLGVGPSVLKPIMLLQPVDYKKDRFLSNYSKGTLLPLL